MPSRRRKPLVPGQGARGYGCDWPNSVTVTAAQSSWPAAPGRAEHGGRGGAALRSPAAAASRAWPRRPRARSSRASSTSRRSAGAAPLVRGQPGVRRRQRLRRVLQRGEQAPDHVHRRSGWSARPRPARSPRSTVRAYGASSSRCEGCAKPAIVASTSALDSASDSTTCAHACALTAAEGRAARQRTWCRLPDAVSSRASSAASAASSTTPCAASGSRNAQRSSWSTSRPSIFAVPSSRPAQQLRGPPPARAAAAKNRAQASWCSLPGSAARSSRSAPRPGSRAPVARQLRRRVVRPAPTSAQRVQHLQHADVGLAAREAQHQVHEVPARAAARPGSGSTAPTSTARGPAGRSGRPGARAAWPARSRRSGSCSRSGRRR